MAHLRSIDKIYDPDDRQSIFNHASVGHYHQMLSPLVLNSKVPDEIKIHFNTAKNLFLYSWFVYEFATVSQFQAKSSVEFALKEKAKIETPNIAINKNSLRNLLAIAIENRWIVDTGFVSVIKRNRSIIDSNDDQAYCKTLMKVLPQLRNDLAHGSSTLVLPVWALANLEICADLINQLYPI